MIPASHHARSPESAPPDPGTPCNLSLAGRALANSGTVANAFQSAATWSLALFLLAACKKEPPSRSLGVREMTKADLAELVEVLTPLGKAVTSDITDRRLQRGLELLARLRAGGRENGLEALALLGEKPRGDTTRPVDVERGLLDVAAHAAPQDARPLLEVLVTQYGASLELRTDAALLLAETSPERALEVLQPMVVKAHPSQTQPPAEFLVKSWVLACDRTGRSPVPELADVATNLLMDETARIRAVKELGKRPEPLAIQVLQAILIESTGDGYLRRMAAQGIRDSLPKESACEVFNQVADREADLSFLQFLRDMLEKNCEHGAPAPSNPR
jgi:HEAT repeat protein